ncbi:MAG: M67 family metallopeptidase [Propionibacteriaceae bacterium]|jgi:proteasome lid subunit RPN8/RPN11|nr:M67 family metallopeptidase [Propionibacteriaceae bacterium]
MIDLPLSIAKRVHAEGVLAFPNECCGALLGSVDAVGTQELRHVVDILALPNTREAEEQYHRFVITPEDYLRAEQFARTEGLDLVGFYHSHPNAPARPSDYDREHAWPNLSYVIVATLLRDGKAAAGDVTSWELSLDRSRFDAEEQVAL